MYCCIYTLAIHGSVDRSPELAGRKPPAATTTTREVREFSHIKKKRERRRRRNERERETNKMYKGRNMYIDCLSVILYNFGAKEFPKSSNGVSPSCPHKQPVLDHDNTRGSNSIDRITQSPHRPSTRMRITRSVAFISFDVGTGPN